MLCPADLTLSTHFLRFVQSSECEWIAVLRVTRGTHQFSLDFLSKWLEMSCSQKEPRVRIPNSPPKKNPQKCGFFLCSCGFSSFLAFANIAVSCGLFAYRLHRNYTVKYPLQLRRGHLFTTPSLTLRVPRTKGAFALCLRRERPCRWLLSFCGLQSW